MHKRLLIFFLSIVYIQSINAQSHKSEMPDKSNPRRHYNPIIPDASSDKKVIIYHHSFNQNTSINCPPNFDFEEGNFNNWRCDTGVVQGLMDLIPLRDNSLLVFLVKVQQD